MNRQPETSSLKHSFIIARRDNERSRKYMQRIIAEFLTFLIGFLLLFVFVVYIVFIRKGIFPSKQEYLNRKDLSKEQINTCLKIKKYFEIPFMIIMTIILILGMTIALPILRDVKYMVSGNYPQFSGEIKTTIVKTDKRTRRDKFVISNGKKQLEISAYANNYDKGDYVTVQYLPHCEVGSIIKGEHHKNQ